MSSVRFVGSGNFDDDILTMYNGQEFTGGEDIFIRNDDNLGVFSNTTESLIIVGQASWTIYSTKYYQGGAICLTPSPVYNGAGELSSLNVPNNAISSVQKGCQGDTVYIYGN